MNGYGVGRRRNDGGEAAAELRRIVGINEEIKSIVATAFKINLMALNAIFLAKKAGRAALGFGVLSNELRGFSVQLGEQMTGLRQLTSGSVKLVTDLVKAARRIRILERTDAESKGRARAILKAVSGASIESSGSNELSSLRLNLTQRLDDTWRLVELGAVLARSAKIEAAYGGAFSGPLMQVSTDFEKIIGAIKESLENLKKHYTLERRG
ncbi:MAG: chemotaxis protein [Rhodocyclaceae bacterium]|nr:chemotaxis protein [Rhodocyclaceae bacterium]